MFLYEAMHADALQLGRQNQDLVRLQRMVFVDDLQDVFQGRFELRIVADRRRAQLRDSAAGFICSGSKS